MGETVDDHLKLVSTIREEMRFEISVFHDRINALISAEAFLLISFTMALNSGLFNAAGTTVLSPLRHTCDAK